MFKKDTTTKEIVTYLTHATYKESFEEDVCNLYYSSVYFVLHNT